MDFPDSDLRQRRSSDGMLIQCKNCRDRRRPSRVHGHCQVCRRKVCPDCKQLNKKAALMSCNKMLKDDNEANSPEVTLHTPSHGNTDLACDRDTSTKNKTTSVTSSKTKPTYCQSDLLQSEHNTPTLRLFASDKMTRTTITRVPNTTGISRPPKLFRNMSTQTPSIKKLEILSVDNDADKDSPDDMQNHNITLVDKATDVKIDGFHEHCRHLKESASSKSFWSEVSADSASPDRTDIRDQTTGQNEPIAYPATSDTPTQIEENTRITARKQGLSPVVLHDTSEDNLTETIVCTCSKQKRHFKRKHKVSTKCTPHKHKEDDKSTSFCKHGSDDNVGQNIRKSHETLDRNPTETNSIVGGSYESAPNSWFTKTDQHKLKFQPSEVKMQCINSVLDDQTNPDPKRALIKPNTGLSPKRSTLDGSKDSHRNKSKRTSLKNSVIIEDTMSTNMTTKVEIFRINSKTKHTKVIHVMKELQPEPSINNILVKSDNDSEDCDISGMALLSVDELVLADKGNNKLKVVDLVRKELMVEIVLRVGVRSVCAVPGRRFGVTVPERNIIKLLALQDDKVVEDRDIECEGCDGYCCGLAYNDGSFIISFVEPSAIQVIKLGGQIIHTFPMISKVAKSLITFQTPQYISVWEEIEGDNTTSAVYISDTSANVVIKTDSTGNTSDVFRFPDKWFPLSVQATSGDEFLVCSSSRSSVFKIKGNDDNVVAESIVMVDRPKLLCYCPDKQVMYVTMPKYAIAGEICNYVKIYPL